MIRNVSHHPLAMRLALSLQHLLAVFAGTVFVPIVLGLSIPLALLFSGVSTLMFHYFTSGKIPFYYGSSFTILAGMTFIHHQAVSRGMTDVLADCYVCLGSLFIGVIYLLVGQLLRMVPREKVIRLFPSTLAAPLIMVIGIDMLFSSTYSIRTDWLTGIVTIVAVALAQLFFKGRVRLFSIFIGMAAGLVLSLVRGTFSLDALRGAHWLASPFDSDFMAFRVLEHWDVDMAGIVFVTVLPLAVIALSEHVADMIVISCTAKKNYLRIIGLPRSISASGLATLLAAVFGASQPTAYTQTTGLIRLNRICDPSLLRMVAVMMIVLSCCPKLTALISSIPAAVIGGITFIMYIMVIWVGWCTARLHEKKNRNARSLVIIFSTLAAYAITAIFFDGGLQVGSTKLTSITVAFITGLVLHLAIPNRAALTPQEEHASDEDVSSPTDLADHHDEPQKPQA